MKKILSLVLAAMMVLTMAPAVFAAEVVAAEDASQYQEAIDFLSDDGGLGIWKGTEDGDAALEGVQRWQMAHFVARLTTGYTDDAYWATPENDSGFDDIDIGDFAGASETCYGTISYAAQKGIVRGVSDTKFAPADGITYRDAQTMLVRALGFQMSGAAYPWGFITKAQELGLTEGLTGIGHTDELNRGQVAQLLYNALFVEVEGKTLAEKAFGLEQADVIITASNRVVYEAGKKPVLKTGYIRYAEINAQGEPTVNEYHAPIASFDLADSKAADAAVGTLYRIYHNDDHATIFSVESHTKTYMNYGHDAMDVIKFTSDKNYKYSVLGGTPDYYVEIAGVGKWVIVDLYTDLSNKQGLTSDPTGTAEMKVYADKGGVIYGSNSDYIIASNGDIYRVGDIAVDAVLSPWLVYSSVMDAYYGRDYSSDNGDGIPGLSWRLYSKAEVEQILKGAAIAAAGFSQYKDSSPSASAYTKAVVSYNQRMTVRNYKLGVYTTAKQSYEDAFSTTCNTANNVFQIKYSPNGSETNTSAAPFSVAEIGGAITEWEDAGNAAFNDNDTYHAINMYSFTGKTPASGDYIIYYLNTETRELEVLEIINSKSAEATGNYITSGYLRSYDAVNNKIYIENSITGASKTLDVGYNSLIGSPIKTQTGDKIYQNITLIRPMINSYVTVVVIDDRVVFINSKTGDDEIVVIDQFTDFGADGIHALAYTTDGEAYEEIVIGSYNGWSVGGYEYSLYYLSGLFPTMNQYKIPFNVDTPYKVVYTETVNGQKVYNLTDAAPIYDCDTEAVKEIGVNKYNLIYGINGSNIALNKYQATDASDFWLIVDKTGAEVKYYHLNGKVNPELRIYGADIYKVADRDYVFVLEGDDYVVGLDNVVGTQIKYVVWNEEMTATANSCWFNPNNAYNWTINMNNLFDGTNVVVTIDPALVNAMVEKNGGWNGLKLVASNPVEVFKTIIGLEDGRIYKISDKVIYNFTTPVNVPNVLSSNVPATIEEASAFYGATQGYKYLGSLTIDSSYKTNAKIKGEVQDLVADALFSYRFNGDVTALNAYADTLGFTLYTVHKDYGYLRSTSNDADVEAVTKNGGSYTVYFIYNEAGKAIAWLFGETATAAAVTATLALAKSGEGINYENANSASVANADYVPVVSVVAQTGYNKLAVTIEAGVKGIAFDAANDEIVVYTAESGDVVATDVVVGADGRLVSATVELPGAAAATKVVIQINRAANTEMYLEYTLA